MEINIDGLRVLFPYKSIYEEQLAYMRSLKVRGRGSRSRGRGC